MLVECNFVQIKYELQMNFDHQLVLFLKPGGIVKS